MLPIILPTEERVACMLEGTSRSPDTVVGQMRPTGTREAWEYTVEKVAVNAVMAGAKPEYLPCHSGTGGDGRLGAGQHDQFRRVHGHGQRSRPP